MININLKPRVYNVNKKYYDNQSDSNSSSCMCSSDSDEASDNDTNRNNSVDRKKHDADCKVGKKITFKFDELNMEAI